MEKELKDLKSVLRSLVVSSPAQMDVRSLQRDYRNMMGSSIPISKYGYRDILAFLKERCGDCFLFQGMSSNPVLTLIVPDSLKHIDQFVQRSKPTSATKMKGKRRSVAEAIIKPPVRSNFQDRPTYNGKPNYKTSGNLITDTFNKKSTQNLNNQRPEVRPAVVKSESVQKSKESSDNMHSRNKELTECKPSYNTDNGFTNKHEENGYNTSSMQYFSKKSVPKYDSSLYLDPDTSSEAEKVAHKDDNDSGRLTSSSRSSTRRNHLEVLKSEIFQLIQDQEDGVLCTDLMRLYRERYGRELDFHRAGLSSITSVLTDMEESVWFAENAGDTRVYSAPPAGAPRPAPRARPLPVAVARPLPEVDPDDALPGIAFDPDVFPADCMHFMESIPAVSLDDVCAGAMLEVTVGEVYSPSHFWLQRLGPDHSQRMHDLMDDMLAYYESGAGSARVLARGAMRVGHYCASLFDRDWHRSLIVKIIDVDTVKVRHVDYGTVDTVPASSLKPLLREYAALPVQAVRARLAGLRPGTGARRWTHAASAHFLRLVRDRAFIANVVAIETEESTVETFLIDTSGEDDVNISTEMIESGHADARADRTLGVSAPRSRLDVCALARTVVSCSERAASELSASASELVDAPPRRMPSWEPHSPPDTVVAASTVSTATASSRYLARMRALSQFARSWDPPPALVIPTPSSSKDTSGNASTCSKSSGDTAASRYLSRKLELTSPPTSPSTVRDNGGGTCEPAGDTPTSRLLARKLELVSPPKSAVSNARLCSSSPAVTSDNVDNSFKSSGDTPTSRFLSRMLKLMSPPASAVSSADPRTVYPGTPSGSAADPLPPTSAGETPASRFLRNKLRLSEICDSL